MRSQVLLVTPRWQTIEGSAHHGDAALLRPALAAALGGCSGFAEQHQLYHFYLEGLYCRRSCAECKAILVGWGLGVNMLRLLRAGPAVALNPALYGLRCIYG